MMLSRALRFVVAMPAVGLLAASISNVVAQQPTQTYRSVHSSLPRIPDEQDRPFWRETQSHRGWEIREDQYTVFANTSQADARWASAQAKEAWASAAGLADHWTQLHRQPDFGLNSTQIVLDSQPPSGRDAPLTTVNVVGIQTQIYLNVSRGQPRLEQQMLQLREGVAFAMLHTVGLDSAAPPWVVQGLAAVAAEQGIDPAALEQAREIKLAAEFGGQQWRYNRSQQDRIDYPAINNGQATAAMKFLLVGDDARNAPELLSAISSAWATAEQSAARGRDYRGHPGDAQLPASHTAFDKLLATLHPQFEAWQRDPLAGQPRYEPAADLSPELLGAQREMLVLLKLQSRFARSPDMAETKPRVVEFRRETGLQVVSAEVQTSAPAPITVQALYARLVDPAEPQWATLDERGELLLSSNRQRIDELFGLHQQRYTVLHDDKRLGLRRRLDSGQVLEGWLEASSEKQGRPLAKFAIVESRSRTKVQTPGRAVEKTATRPLEVRVLR